MQSSSKYWREWKGMKGGEQMCHTVALLPETDRILACSHYTHTHCFVFFTSIVMYFHALLFNSHLILLLKMSVFLSASLASKILLLLLILIVTIVPLLLTITFLIITSIPRYLRVRVGTNSNPNPHFNLPNPINRYC